LQLLFYRYSFVENELLMKNRVLVFLLLIAVFAGMSSCAVKRSASSPKMSKEASPDKSEPVPGAEILIEQENNQVPPQK
jgi:hypothetical protein